MGNEFNAAEFFYFQFREAVESGKITKEKFREIIDSAKKMFMLTEFDLRESKPEFRNFVVENGFLISAVDKYGFTDSFQQFKDSFDRLNVHLDFSHYALTTLYEVAESNFESVLKSLDISEESNLYDWDNFEEKLLETQNEIIFEQSLISLLTIFEAYITHILQWIFQKDESARHKMRVNIDYDEVLENLDDIIPFLVVKRIEQIRGWDDRIETIQSKPIQIKIKDRTEYRIIKDAIIKRNLLIHNRGIVHSRFLREINNNDVSNCKIKNEYSLDDKIKIHSAYYYQVQGAIENLVKFIDDKVKEKYS